ncbi:hypothetical protein [Nocardia jiangsuensis]|uniref:Uncharacterized protein n=1 Tax=Nocardia jiangsuensis TaxID=1691563 RepID=A0ABV8DLS8_9NOCA
MAWGNKGRTDVQVPVEFDIAGRTYRVEMTEAEVSPYYVANALLKEVSVKTDLLTGQQVVINWSLVGVIRKL